ncbi:MAG: Stk1 family PASTA domain-containing Ser/Thr kinase [Mycobacteriaceae bacterium]
MTTPRHLSDRYLLGETLGFGGMSEVHLARDERLSREVAIKVLRADLARDPSFYLRFRREAQNAAALNHPAIVAIYDTGEATTDAGPLPYIVMEYVEGVTLRDLVRSDGPLTPRRAMEIIADVCAALDFSHRNGIVHRDVKPANIMLNKTGAVKVMDFGIARALSDTSSTMTQTAAVIGTAQYLSPEQARGEQVDARSDVYSLGCVLFEILTGEPPFTGDSPVAVAYQHVREDPRPPSLVHSGIPRELDSVVLKAMSKNPANRYQSAAEMRADIVRVLSGQRPSAPTVMTEEDRTTLLGSAATSSRNGRHRGTTERPRSLVESDTEDEPQRNKIAMVLGSIIGIALLALVVTFAINYFGGSRTKDVSIPDVAGKTANEAIIELQKLGFEPKQKQVSDNIVASGSVVRTIPGAGVSTPEGSDVTVEVSTGPQAITIPDLTGLSYEAAKSKLKALGFTNILPASKASSEANLKDKISTQFPAANTLAAITAPITLTVGTGPAEVRMPDVAGQNVEVARGNILGAGFKSVDIREVDAVQPIGQVISTDPVGGTTVTVDTQVTILVSKGNQFTMPDLTNMNLQTAIAALKSAGWTGTIPQTTNVPVGVDTTRVGVVVSQGQPVGSAVDKNAQVTLGIGRLGI